jgi:hypothetical protein
MSEFICGNRYRFGSRTIGLPVAVSDLPKEIEGYKLLAKTEFHVSLVYVGRIADRYGITDSNFERKVIDDFCAYTAENKVEFARFTGEFRFVDKEDRKTVVAMCEILNLTRFIELLNTKYSLTLEYPPTHVTLYTLQLNVGVFLIDSEDLQKSTKIIPAPVNL